MVQVGLLRWLEQRPQCRLRPGVGGAWRFDADPGACKWDFSHDGQASVYTPGAASRACWIAARPLLPAPTIKALRFGWLVLEAEVDALRCRPWGMQVGL
jgi:hypothetical protein